MRLFEEELLEPIIRPLRFNEGLAKIRKDKPIILVDLGCGPKIRFYHYASRKGINYLKYIGIDPLINHELMEKNKNNKKINLVKSPLKKKIPLNNNSVDYVTGFAFIEHINNPSEIVNDSLRVLKPGGKAIFTTPSNKAKGVLEFLSFKLGIISKDGVLEHKNYFQKEKLIGMVKLKNTRIQHHYFEFGYNNLLVIKKLK